MTNLEFISWSFVVWIHVVAAITWVGGMVFVALVLVPALRGVPPEQRSETIRSVGLAAKGLGWISLLVLLLTGGLNAIHLHPNWDSLAGQILLAKISVVGGLVGLTILHDFILAPKLTEIRRAVGVEHPTFRRLQSAVRWLARINLILALCVIFLAVLLVRS